MDRKSFELLYQDAVEALTSRRMHDALNCIRGILFNTENPELNRELESVQQDYGMMLTFISQGGTDPQQALVHRNLTHRAFTLLDKSARLYHVRYENDLYAETYNRCDADQTASFDQWLETADLLREKLSEERGKTSTGEAEENSFYNAGVQLYLDRPSFHAADAEKLKNFIEAGEKTDEQALLVGAVILNAYNDISTRKNTACCFISCRTEHTRRIPRTGR